MLGQVTRVCSLAYDTYNECFWKIEKKTKKWGEDFFQKKNKGAKTFPKVLTLFSIGHGV